jgi:exonuclease SbcC
LAAADALTARQAMCEAAALRQAHDDEVAKWEAAVEAARLREAELLAKWEAAKALASSGAWALTESATAEAASVAASRALDAARNAASRAGALRDTMPPEPDQDRLTALDQAVRRSMASLGEIGAAVETARGLRAGAADAAATAYQAASREATEAGHRAQFATRALQDGQSRAGLLGSVPCGGGSWGPPTDIVDMSTCAFLQEARKAREGLPAARQTAQDATEASQAALAAMEAAKANLDAIQASRAKADAQDAGTILVARQAHQAAQGDLDAARASTAAWRASATGLADLTAQAARIPDLTKVAEDAAGHFLRTRQAALAAAAAAADAAALETQVADAAATVRAAVAMGMECRLAATTCREELAVLAARVEAGTRATEAAEALRGSRRDAVRHQAAWQTYQRAMDRDGLPFLLVEKFAIPGLEAGANRYLESSDFRLTVRGERELSTGEARNAVYVTFTDHRGSHPLSAASGYQRMAIGMAIRNALADLHGQVTGSRIHLAIQDEGFGTADAANLEAAKATIRDIAERRERFLFVSHLPAMAEAADTVIQVRDAGGHSTAEVQ